MPKCVQATFFQTPKSSISISHINSSAELEQQGKSQVKLKDNSSSVTFGPQVHTNIVFRCSGTIIVYYVRRTEPDQLRITELNSLRRT